MSVEQSVRKEGPKSEFIAPKKNLQLWSIIRTLGEGTFGEVKLVVDRNNDGYPAAMKCVSSHSEKEIIALRKEAVLTKKCRGHPNIVYYIGMREDKAMNEYQLFLEYCDGGELYDRIEPDVGLPIVKCQHYFRQLIEGVKYIHSLGITHRDIKPENILLLENDVLKIADFGMATIFRNDGNERFLDTTCGSKPYIAPEVFIQSYKAEPNDIWACGIVLVAMLSGVLPWEEATSESNEFKTFILERSVELNPFNRMDLESLQLIKIILEYQWDKRATIQRIQNHSWMKTNFGNANATMVRKKRPFGMPHSSTITEVVPRDSSDNPVIKKSKLQKPLYNETGISAQSQPLKINLVPQTTNESYLSALLNRPFTQPDKIDPMLLNNSQVVSSLSQKMYNPLEKLVRRMTRLVVNLPVKAFYKQLKIVLEQLKYDYRILDNSCVYVKCVTKMDECSFRISMLNIPNTDECIKLLVDFTRSRGDGLLFKRHFLYIKDGLTDLIPNNILPLPVNLV
uniref:non-specific serine/threonine protein kinase n=1 Tax=Parastrongyloides trichosuri TaxID=131310 RepID=A0A0N4ZWY0_PARTI